MSWLSRGSSLARRLADAAAFTPSATSAHIRSRAFSSAASAAEWDDDAVQKRLDQQKAFVASVMEMVPKWVKGATIHKANDRIHQGGEMVFDVEPENIVPFMRFLKLHSSSQFKLYVDGTAVDYPQQKQRFRVVHNLMSCKYNARVRIQTYVDELTPIESASGIFPGANWFEREIWDLYGVFFHSHPDLRRILTDYGFEGHPQRKDFPLSGYVEVRYDDTEKRVVTEPVEIAQEYRAFDMSSPWSTFTEPKQTPEALPEDPAAPSRK